jgi:DNA repair protein RecN (Recombination protein N)
MLESLHIQNFAIIEDLTVVFGPGLNILTGETGAGKSILIGAIQLLMGGKGGGEQIRQGAEEAVVEGIFDLSKHPKMAETMASLGLDQSGQVLLRRIVGRSGKSRAYVNGQFSTLQILTELARGWVNIYGQHEHQSLLQPERNVELLDEYGSLLARREQWDRAWRDWWGVKSEIKEAISKREQAEASRDLWEFQCREIEGANLLPNEEAGLEQERQILHHAQRLRDGLLRAEETLYGEEGSALEKIQTVRRELEALSGVDPRLSSTVEMISGARVYLEEGLQSIRGYMREVTLDPERLQAVEERIAEIQRLKRKYKGTLDEVISLAQELRFRLQTLEEQGDLLEGLLSRQADLEKGLLALGEALRKERSECGECLCQGVERELRGLGIDRPVFQVRLSPLDEGESLGVDGVRAGPTGIDRVEFFLSTNLGEPPRPLSKIASGGELSRIMLALKEVLAEAEKMPTLIFDEIDAGIGGAIAQALGEKLASIAHSHQVLCITHLPQVARYAGNHFKVRKDLREGRTVANVEPLGDEERVEEISRMLGGKVITDRTRAHARELLRKSAP